MTRSVFKSQRLKIIFYSEYHMKIHRVFSVILRFVFAFKYSLERLTDAFYWPVIELLTWGLTSRFLQSYFPNASVIVLIFLSGLLLNVVIWRGQYEITISMLWDVWNKNMINLFVSPLKFSEWIGAFLILSLIKALVSFSFASVVAYLLYKFQILSFGFYLVPFVILLLMTSWWMGFFISGLILTVGRRVEAFAWTLGAIISPFSAVFYPVSILPSWGQKIASIIPTSYIFEGVREIILKGTLDINKLYICFLLNVIYLILSVIFFRRSFNKVLQRGMVNIF